MKFWRQGITRNSDEKTRTKEEKWGAHDVGLLFAKAARVRPTEHNSNKIGMPGMFGMPGVPRQMGPPHWGPSWKRCSRPGQPGPGK